MGSVANALRDAWSLIAPIDCAGCGSADRALCADCGPALQPRLQHAALSLDAAGDAVPLVAALEYDAVVRRVILALKEGGRTELARSLAPPLLAAVGAAWHAADLLVPVPGSPSSLGRRGFQPVALLARRAGLVTAPALRAVGRSAVGDEGWGVAQKQRSLGERQALDESRWLVRSDVRGRRVVVLDDVATSGATLRSAARALERAGAEVVGCAVLAATPRRVGVSSIPWQFMADEHPARDDNTVMED